MRLGKNRRWIYCAAALFLSVIAHAGNVPAQERFTEGRLKGFIQSQTESIIIELGEPISVRAVEGVILSAVEDGPMPRTVRVVFEIRGPGSNETVKGQYTDKNGRFRLREIKEGTYMFKATANGWQSVSGTLIVTKKASKSNRIEIRMNLGV